MAGELDLESFVFVWFVLFIKIKKSVSVVYLTDKLYILLIDLANKERREEKDGELFFICLILSEKIESRRVQRRLYSGSFIINAITVSRDIWMRKVKCFFYSKQELGYVVTFWSFVPLTFGGRIIKTKINCNLEF